jgi:hypothetical protein
MLHSSSHPYQHRMTALKDLNDLIQKLPIKGFSLRDDLVHQINKYSHSHTGEDGVQG